MPRKKLAIVCAVLVLALVPRLLGFTDPWSTVAPDFHGAFGASFTGGPVSHMATHGLWQRGGLPYVWGIETGDGSWIFSDYTHHPATFMWLCALSLELFGRVEWAMRLVPLLGSLFSVWALARLGHAVGGARLALVAAVLTATLPFAARHGVQLWTEGTIMGTTALVLVHHLAWLRDGQRSHLLRAALWILVGTAFDWTALFVLPALGLHALFAPNVAAGLPLARRAWPLLWLPLAGAVPVALHALHLVLVTDFHFLRAEGGTTVANIVAMPAGLDLFGFVRLQGLYAVDGLTWLGTVLLLIGAVTAHRRFDACTLAIAWIGLTPALWYVFLFPGRSFNHDFFQMVGLPGAVLFAGAALLSIEEWVRRVRPAAAKPIAHACLAAVAIAGIARCVSEYRHHRDDTMRAVVSAPQMEELLADERVLLLTHVNSVGSFLPFYARGQVRDTFNDLAGIAATIELAHTHLHREWRLVFLVDHEIVGLVPGAEAIPLFLDGLVAPIEFEAGGRRLALYELLSRGR